MVPKFKLNQFTQLEGILVSDASDLGYRCGMSMPEAIEIEYLGNFVFKQLLKRNSDNNAYVYKMNTSMPGKHFEIHIYND